MRSLRLFPAMRASARGNYWPAYALADARRISGCKRALKSGLTYWKRIFPYSVFCESFDEKKSSCSTPRFFVAGPFRQLTYFVFSCNVETASRQVVPSYRVKRKARLRRPSISPPLNAREVEHTKARARTFVAAAYSISAVIGALLIRNHGNRCEQK